MSDLVVGSKVPIILMHMRGTPKNMQQNCEYKNVVTEVAAYLLQRAKVLENRGVAKEKIIFDPGIGFAKNIEQNLQLMQGLKSLTGLGYPVLLAASRKSTIGSVLGGIPAEERWKVRLLPVVRLCMQELKWYECMMYRKICGL